MTISRRLLAVGLAATLLATGAAACGDDSEDATTTTAAPDAATTTADPSVSAYDPQFRPFARCVSEQGVEPPPPLQWMAPGGVTAEMLRAAAACRQYLPPYGQQILDQALRGR
jgi:hypothetical protein